MTALLKLRLSAVGLAMLTVFGASSATPVEAAGAFSGLSGSWSGSGTVRLAGGKTEQLKCTAYYTERGSGTGLGLAIRCANASSKIDMRANLTSTAGKVTGSWEERQYNAAGSATGSATGNRIQLSISGGGLSGSMSVTTNGRTQSVSISTTGTGLESVSINLSKG